MKKPISRRKELISYLNTYCQKEFIIKHILEGIRIRLLDCGNLTRKQLGVLLPFLEREPKFKMLKRSDIISYFLPLVKTNNLEGRQYVPTQTYQF